MKNKAIRILSLCMCIILLLSASSCKKNDTHTHTFSDLWTYDTTYHWKSPTCGDTEEVAEKAEHTFVKTSEIQPTFESNGYTVYSCTVCGYEKQVENDDMLSHSYSSDWSYNSETHWHACTDKGYEDLKADESEHTLVEDVITAPTDTSTGIAHYTCPICGLDEERVLKIPTTIITIPSVSSSYFVGQPLSDVILSGGTASTNGTFSFKDPTETLKPDGEYDVIFTPSDEKYATSSCTVKISATQLKVTIVTGENGTSDPNGTVNVDYNSNLDITFTPNFGYAVEKITVDGVSVDKNTSYTLKNITSDHTVSVSFCESENKVSVTCQSGTNNCYTINGSTITFSGITEDSVYTISGEMIGNIVIDVGDDYKFELELQSFTIASDKTSPIVIISGDKVTITAKKDTENYVYDKRPAVDSSDETQYSSALYSTCDLDLKGKGKLTVVSDNNNGIHSKDDLDVKNLTLSVTCMDNALKGNDGVTINSGNITLIAKAGDGIKTSNSSLSKKGNQKGSVEILGGTITIYAACDGIDAAFDVIVDNAETELNIYTASYSEYSEDVSQSSGTYYIRFTNKSYNYSIKYYNSDSDYIIINAKYKTSVKSGRTTYYYYEFEKKAYDSFKLFVYSSDQTVGQETDYLVCTDYMSWNSAYDTLALKQSGSSLSYSWTKYSSSQDQFGGMGRPGGMGGMDDGNTDKLDYSAKGTKAGNSVTVNAGNIYIKAYDDAIHANSDSTLESGATPLGNVTVFGGTLTLYSNDDGIHADGILTVSGGSVTVENSYEGLEGTFVNISGGDINIISADDGINATTKSGQGIVFSGGNVYIYAKGDGVDSNSTTSYEGIVFSGGNIVIICNSNGNSAIDTERGYKYTGGSVLAIMTRGGMTSETTNCQSFSNIGTKTNISLKEGATVTVKVGQSSVLTATMPVSMSAFVVYLGSNSATIS